MKRKVNFVMRAAYNGPTKYRQLFVGYNDRNSAQVRVGNIWLRGFEYVGFDLFTGNEVRSRFLTDCRQKLELSVMKSMREIWSAVEAA